MFRGKPPCSRFTASNISCDRLTRRRRVIRAVEAISSVDRPDYIGHIDDSSSSKSLDKVAILFGSLGAGDSPRKLKVPGFGDISKQSSILVDFLSQDFSVGATNDYQVTFNDNYTSITRILANEFGRGFEEDIYHYRDAPFVERTQGGIPRNTSSSERAVLDLHGLFILPSPEISNSSVLAFFDRVHPTLPIIDRSSFLRNYYSISTDASNISLLLVQSILLSGSTTFENPGLNSAPEEVSWKLYTRTKALIENRFEQDRLTLVQSHLLISTFASDSCDYTIQNMWLSLGSAVRVAQGKRMQMILCAASGNESGGDRVPYSDVEELDEADFQPDEPGSLPTSEHTHFFLELCKLCFIISEWLDLLRPGGVRNPKQMALKGLENLRKGLPWLRRLGKRSSVASQGLMFYEELVTRLDKRGSGQPQVSSLDVDISETQPGFDTNYECEIGIGVQSPLDTAGLDSSDVWGWGDYPNQFST
ncbi:hypothetical protein BP6252_13605 [Coleophoma cylindrospora]|uniref:Xylanolytic transcriptional activator regulatory domain-containing protein n=1 Tax=Coleophoma cylindrospora TaxID=1849047 RepID=A0A3D8Q9R3_9HELO|nr:hypothetical protein BP6252_13605 [Coleophoma cylindrospora]